MNPGNEETIRLVRKCSDLLFRLAHRMVAAESE
jgi:hypothetical protein